MRMQVRVEQTDLGVAKVKRLADELNKAGGEENVKQSYDDVVDAATHLADVLEKEEKAKEGNKGIE